METQKRLALIATKTSGGWLQRYVALAAEVDGEHYIIGNRIDLRKYPHKYNHEPELRKAMKAYGADHEIPCLPGTWKTSFSGPIERKT